MRFVDRSKVRPPEFFLYDETLVRMRQDLLEMFRQGDSKLMQSSVGRVDGHIREAVFKDLLDLFQGRCAYCEQEGNCQPYPFRPATEAEPVEHRSTSHLYYSWLTTSWDNWLLICQDCYPRNPAYFPVAGKRDPLPTLDMLAVYATRSESIWKMLVKRLGGSVYLHDKEFLPPSWSDTPEPEKGRRGEQNLLIDPTQDEQLWRHLGVANDGQLHARSERGRETIAHFNLNRFDLLSARYEAIEDLHQRMAEGGLPDSLEGAPFAGTMMLRLRDLVGQMADISSTAVSLQPDNLIANANMLMEKGQGRASLLASLEATDLAGFAPQAKKAASRPRRRKTPRVASTPQRITHLALTNFKSLENLAFDIPLNAKATGDADEPQGAGSLLILGENATGKSTILEGAVLCLSDKRTRKALDLTPKRLVLDPKFMDPSLTQQRDEAQVIATLEDGSTRTLTVTKKAFDAPEEPAPLPVFAYGAFRQYLDEARERLPADHFVSTLFKTDRLLPNPEKWLVSLDPDDFNMVARSLREIFDVDGKFDVIERDGDTCYIVTPYLHGQTKRRERTPLDVVSSGFRAVLAMACDVMRGLMRQRGFQTLRGARGVVLVDEIEAHLHPRWKIAIMSALRRALPNVTFIVTSHDPLCLRGMSSGEVMVLNRVRGESAPDSDLPVFIETLSTLPNIEELTIEQLLTADFFQLNATDSHSAEREYARIADLLRAARGDGEAVSMTAEQKRAVRSFTEQVNHALPVGTTEVQRLVQDAVAEYLKQRADKNSEALKTLREETRKAIVDVLGDI